MIEITESGRISCAIRRNHRSSTETLRSPMIHRIRDILGQNSRLPVWVIRASAETRS